ncbi:two-component system, HptB-dependent secretion and biofilm response regulator [Gammaproteobacteria bacterium]
MKILIVDDNRSNVATTSAYCHAWGHTVVSATNGAQAVERYSTEHPDLILMDVMMPIMNGLEATSRIRTLAETRWVPIILLTALGSEQDLINGIESGADDYLIKPINFTILREKIRVMQRISTIQGELTESLAGLQEYRNRAEEENQLAAHVMDRIVGFGQEIDSLVTHRILPALNFSGDLIGCARTPTGDLHVALADATGHGLAAALNVMPMTEVFYGMTEKGFPISRIAAEMNRKIRRLMPRERFVAAILASIEFSTRTLSIWNGGCPSALFVDKNGEVARSFFSVHPPLGILAEDAFDSTLEVYQWQHSGQLLMCSDGLLEAEDLQGVPFGFNNLYQILRSTEPNVRLDGIISALRRHQGEALQFDDISLMAVECSDFCTVVKKEEVISKRNALPNSGQWHLGLKMGPKEVRRIDVLPFLLDWCKQVGMEDYHLSRLFMVVAELYNNALDHGLLQLDSRVKSEPDGFEKYIWLRSERLEALESGSIILNLTVMQDGILRIHVTDSGPGFDYASYVPVSGNLPFGRGIALVRHICQKVEFHGWGNEVVAHYSLREASPEVISG